MSEYHYKSNQIMSTLSVLYVSNSLIKPSIISNILNSLLMSHNFNSQPSYNLDGKKKLLNYKELH